MKITWMDGRAGEIIIGRNELGAQTSRFFPVDDLPVGRHKVYIELGTPESKEDAAPGLRRMGEQASDER